MLAFRSLDPFRALREPDRRRRDEERLSRSGQRTLSKTQNNHLTGKAPYKFEWDLEKHRARVEVANVLRAHSEPIRNPVTDHEEQMILVLPNGWVFHEAENASGFAKGLGALKFDLNGRHSSLAHIAWNQNGLLHTYDEYKQKFGRP